MDEPRWFTGFSRCVDKEEFDKWVIRKVKNGAFGTQSQTDDNGQLIYTIPDCPAYPSNVLDLPTNDRGVRLGLSISSHDATRRDWQNVLEIVATLSTEKLHVNREVEHRWINITPLLFAIYSDGKAVTKELDGFRKGGGVHYLVELAKPHHPHIWRLYLNQESLLALLPHTRPQRVTFFAAFAESQQTAYFGSFSDELFDLPRLQGGRIEEQEMVLVRSAPVNLQWTGDRWRAVDWSNR